MQKKMIHIQIEKHTEYFTKLLSFDCRTTLNEPRNSVNSAFLGSCTLFKLDFGNYIMCLIRLDITIFCTIILNILCILCRFGTFCKHFATTITSNHSSDISLCTPGNHPLKYETHNCCLLKSAYGLL